MIIVACPYLQTVRASTTYHIPGESTSSPEHAGALTIPAAWCGDGMQEVRGSNPLSSTGQKRNSNGSNGDTAAKYSNAAGAIYAPASPEQALLPRLGCWHGRLNPEPGTVLGAVTRKKRPIRPSIDTCPAAGTWRPFPGDPCRLGNTSGQPCPPGCCCVSSHACGRTAPWRSMVRRLAPGAASSVSRRGCGAPRRNLAHPGARHRAARRGQARDGALIWPRSAPGRAVWLTADSAWNTLATPSEHSGRAPSLRRRQIAEYVRLSVLKVWLRVERRSSSTDHPDMLACRRRDSTTFATSCSLPSLGVATVSRAHHFG